MNTNPTEIGLRIKKARKAAKMSQTVLGTYLNKTLRTIQKYESGEIEPSIATINEIAKVLNVSSAELIGYEKRDVQLNTLADVLSFFHALNKKDGLHFDIEVNRPPKTQEWTCSLRFDGNDASAEHNADLCLFLERFAEERERLETYWIDQDYYEHWFDKELAYYAAVELPDKETVVLSEEERLNRRNELEQEKRADIENINEEQMS